MALAAGALALWRTSAKIGGPADAERSAYTAGRGPTLPELWDSPAFTLANERGSMTSEQELRGKVWIADFIFTTCTAVCPRITATMVRLQSRLLDPRLRFVSFSVDPEHDTVAALASYKQGWNAADSRWTLLRPTPAGLTHISETMRVALEPSEDVKNPILHTSLFFLVDAAGKVRGVYNSSDDLAQQRLIDDVGALLSTLPASTEPSPLTNEAGLDPNSGRGLYVRLGCRACHERPDIAPSLLGLKGRSVMLAGGKQVSADRGYVETALLEPGRQMAAGYLELMPSYRTELEGDKLTKLVDYVLDGLDGNAATAVNPGETSAAPSSAPSASVTALRPSSASATSSPPAAAGAAPSSTSGGASSSNAPSGSAVSSTGGGAPVAPSPAALEVDPVCSMDVRVTASTPAVTHGGHTYHFCSESCRERFQQSPEKFIASSR